MVRIACSANLPAGKPSLVHFRSKGAECRGSCARLGSPAGNGPCCRACEAHRVCVGVCVLLASCRMVQLAVVSSRLNSAVLASKVIGGLEVDLWCAVSSLVSVFSFLSAASWVLASMSVGCGMYIACAVVVTESAVLMQQCVPSLLARAPER
jgi:hypothetical protein